MSNANVNQVLSSVNQFKSVPSMLVLAEAFGITTTSQLDATSEAALLERLVIEESIATHDNALIGMVAIGDAIIRFKAHIEANLALIDGNFTSFKKYVGDKKFGPRSIGYAQMSKYITVAANAGIALELYNGGTWAISKLASEINLATGNDKNVKDKPLVEADAFGIEEAEVVESTEKALTSLAAVEQFIANCSPSDFAQVVEFVAARRK